MLTIDYGIDLGTTNSAIAVQHPDKLELVAGSDSDPLLPSAVHISAAGEVLVGAPARAAMQTDPANTALEFKRQMGTDTRREFPASGRRLAPEELSAEVLRALVGRVATATGEAPRAAVITVPAMFHLPQCDATRRAAALAGIEHAPLLQEPIAAAIAHSGSGAVRDGAWLVYDLGGGTFDVSLVRCRGGRLQVLDHDGDNHLGGRDFDRIIARAAVERIRADGRLGELKRTDPENADAYHRIKAEAERVRLALSREPQARFELEERGVAFTFELDRDELEALLLPTIQRTAALCNKLLTRNRMKAGELSGLVMVGGPTLTPCVPRVVSAQVGIEARHYGDPMTIVARGAALFASTQRLPAGLRRARGAAIELQLEYEAMTTNPSPLCVGKVVSPSPPPPGLQIALLRDGQQLAAAAVQPSGAFALELELLPSQLNVFGLGAVDRAGEALATEPDTLKILHGFSIARPPLSQSIGVMLADNSVSWYLRKGAILPARQRLAHTTMIALARGQSGAAVHVPLVQGESDRADRNKVIGVIHIHADKLDRDLPAGSTVEVTIEVDESTRTTGRAYVPALDQWFDDVVRFDLEAKPAAAVGTSLAAQRDRLASLAALADELETSPADNQGRIAEVEALLEEGDRDSIDLADQMVRRMTEEIDAAEAGGRKLAMAAEFERLRARATALIRAHGEPSEGRTLATLSAELQRALARGDLDAAQAKLDDLESLGTGVMVRQPEFWVGYFEHLRKQAAARGLQQAAAEHLQRGASAIASRDYAALPAACRAILAALPEETSARIAPSIRSDLA
jgi:molecular chaperone DnaK